MNPVQRSFNLVEFATRRRVTVAMVTITFVLFGLIALGSLKVNLLPDMSYPTLTVRTDYEGAAPAEVETLISKPVEEAVGVVKGLRRLKSVSRTGESDVVLEFAWGTDMDKAGLDVRDKLDVLQLPTDAKPPVLLRFNPSTDPIMRLVLSPKGGAASDEEAMRRLNALRRYADDDLKKRLESVSGVAAVKVGGGLEDQIEVAIDQQKLAQLHLSVDAVVKRLQQENINISGGQVQEGTQRFLVRTVNQFGSIDDIRNMLVTTQGAGNTAQQDAVAQMARVAAATGDASAMAAAADVQSNSASSTLAAGGGMPIRLKDVATVRQGFKEREGIIRIDGREAVEIAIYKEGDANTVATADAVTKRLAEIKNQIPPDVTITTFDDQSQFIRHAISDVKWDAVIGGLLAVLIIFLFLRDGWSTFVIGLSLPVSIIATFFFMDQFHLSLNVMSLGGLALATGLVVDDSIVVLESIAKARERGLGILDAAIAGTREVSMAVVASTLTTIAVFLPLVFVEGVAGQLFRDQAMTVAIAIAMSLMVAMTLIPMLSSLKGRPPLAFPEEQPQQLLDRMPDSLRQPSGRSMVSVLARSVAMPFKQTGRGIGAGARGSFFGIAWLIVRIWRGLTAVVGPIMRKASDLAMAPYGRAERFYLRILPAALRRPTLVVGTACVAFALTLAVVPMLGADLIPQLAQDRFDMTVKLPPGTPLRNTDELVAQIQREHAGDPGVKTLYGVSGTGTRLDANPTESGENIGKITVVMTNGGNAKVEAAETDRLRKTMAAFPGVQVDFGRPQLLSASAPLEIELSGPDYATIVQAGTRMAKLLRANNHYADVKSTVEQGFPEIQIHFDQDRASALGLTTRQIADVVVDKVKGNVATSYNFRDQKIDVLVRARDSDRSSVDAIRKLIVNPGSADPVTLDAVADVVSTVGPSEIHRADQVRVAVVSANLHGIDLGTAISEVKQLATNNPLGAGVGMHIGGQGDELAASIRSLLFAFGLAIFMVYLVMASQFESLLHPFVILFTIPLSLVGAVLALLITHSPVSVVVFIGLILLVGLVVKNAIILIDKVNQLREAGVAKREALAEGARSRLRPIMMTTLCTLFGFLPLAIAVGDGAEVRSPMAITVIGGLLMSTLLTLVVIPVVYDLLDRRADAYYVARGARQRERLMPALAGEGNAGVEPT